MRVSLSLLLIASTCLAKPPPKASPLALSFDGKDIAMAWDLGVMQAFLDRWRPETISEIYYVGSSSGSILSSYFACHGLNAASIDRLWDAARELPKDVLNPATPRKMLQLFLGVDPEISRESVNPIVNIATDEGKCLPTAPLLIVAANLDVVDAERRDKPFAGRRDHTFDQGTFEVSEKGKVIGKACTYFVNDAMAKILKEVDPRERLCDLRYLRTGADVRMAIDSSISEPTYFAPVPDPDPSQVESVFRVPSGRTYHGGFIMSAPVQDLKRARPETWILTTGRPMSTRIENRILLNWFSYPTNLALLDQHWWPDAQIPITYAQWAALHAKETTPVQQASWGQAAAANCFATDGCVPKLWTRPRFATDVHGKILDKLRHRGLRGIFK